MYSPAANSAETVESLKAELKELKTNMEIIQNEKITMEEDFSLKKSKFKDMFYAKENLLKVQSTKLNQANLKIAEYESRIQKLTEDMEDFKVVASVSESTKKEAVESIRENHQNELESVQRVLQDSMEEQRSEMYQQFEIERERWDQEKKNLYQQLQQFRKQAGNNQVTLRENEDLRMQLQETSKKLKDELSDHETLKLAVKKVKVLPDDDSGLCVGDIQYLKNILTSQQWELIKTNRSSNGLENESSFNASGGTNADNLNVCNTIGDEHSSSLMHEKTSTNSSAKQESSNLSEQGYWKTQFEEEHKQKMQIECELEKLKKHASNDALQLENKLHEFESVLKELQNHRKIKENDDNKRINELLSNYEVLKKNLMIATQERDKLNVIHSKSLLSERLHNKTVEQLRSEVTKYKENCNTADNEKSQMENKFQSELSFLKNQITVIQHSKQQMENTLQLEIDQLQSQLTPLQNMRHQFENALKENNDLKVKLEKHQMATDSLRTKSRDVVTSLRDKIHTANKENEKLEKELLTSKNQIRSLQENLQTSEQVQRDFVELSQSLQVKLEAIRVENEKKKDDITKNENTASDEESVSTS